MRRIIALLWPVILPPLLVFAVSEDWVDFGGGEKDIFLALPLILFALLNFGAGLFFWHRGSAPGRAAWQACVAALGLLVIIWSVLAIIFLFLLHWA
jgi:hypothetical protein